jgi:hypothetical protein
MPSNPCGDEPIATWNWECNTCGSREPKSATHCRTCRNVKGSPQAPFELIVHSPSAVLIDGDGVRTETCPISRLTEQQLRDGINRGVYKAGQFNGLRVNSTWGPFISIWPEWTRLLKTDGYTGANEGHNEDW